MRFLPEIKPSTPVTARKDSQYAFAMSAPSGATGRPYKDSWNIDRAIREGLQKVIPVFRAIHSIADNQARLPIEVRSGSEEGPPIPEHPLVTLLNQRANEDESAYVFRYRLSTQVNVSRKGAFIEIVNSRMGDPVGLYLLDPRKTHPIPGKTRLVDGFAIDMGHGEVRTLKPEQVAWVRLPHPVDPLSGITPLEAAGLSIDMDVLARLYNRYFLQNDGRPGGIVGVKGDMDDDTADFLEARFNGGTKGAGRVTVLEADGLDWVDTATTPRDAQYIEGLNLTKTDILGAFGVPESYAYGNAAQRTYDNVEAERSIFWEAAELGHLALLGDGLNQVDQDPSTFVVFDTSKVEALQKIKASHDAALLAEYAGGGRTLDSYLVETGRKPTGTAEGKAYWRPMGDVPVVFEDGAVPTHAPAIPAVPPSNGKVPAGG